MANTDRNGNLMKKYTGEERRMDYCPVHNIKCEEIRNLQVDQKKRVPIWVFTLFVAATFSIFGFLNFSSMKRHETALKALEKHIGTTNEVMTENKTTMERVRHALNEVAYNLRSVMKQNDIDFEDLPDYTQ